MKWAHSSICYSFITTHLWRIEVGTSCFFQKSLSPNIQAQPALITDGSTLGQVSSFSQKERTGVTVPQFTYQAVHFSKLLKMPRNVGNCQGLSHYPDLGRFGDVQKCFPQAAPHTQTRYQPPASQSISFEIEVQHGSKQLLLKSKTQKQEKAVL